MRITRYKLSKAYNVPPINLYFGVYVFFKN